MSLTKRGKHWYGENQTDVRAELLRYSRMNGYPAQHFADSECRCGSRRFRLSLDETEGVAVRNCAACGGEHPIGDSADYLAEPSLKRASVPAAAIPSRSLLEYRCTRAAKMSGGSTSAVDAPPAG